MPEQVHRKRVHWDTEFNRLHVNGSTFCHTKPVDGHWVLENNSPDHVDQVVETVDFITDLTTDLITEITPELTTEITFELNDELDLELTSELEEANALYTSMEKSQHLISDLTQHLDTEVNTNLNLNSAYQMTLDSDTSGLDQHADTAANNPNFESTDEDSYSFVTTVPKLGGYVERLPQAFGGGPSTEHQAFGRGSSTEPQACGPGSEDGNFTPERGKHGWLDSEIQSLVESTGKTH